MKPIRLPSMNPQVAADSIAAFINERVRLSNTTGGVIGLSGGVDSTATAAIVKYAFDSAREESGVQSELVGYMLPAATSSPADSQDAIRVAEKLGIRYEILDIEPIIRAYEGTNPEALAVAYHRGNLSSRIRANVLSTKAATEKKLVIGTGNRDEDYGIGYYTLFGDGAVHLSPIGGLSKRLVREMARFFGFDVLADREPTAALEPGQSDFGDLGYRYDLVEIVTAGLDQGFSQDELAEHPQVIEPFEQQREEYETRFGSPKFSNPAEMIADLARRHETARWKAEIISPPVAPVVLNES